MTVRSPGGWHSGEETMHRLLQVPYEDDPTAPGLPGAYGRWMAHSPLLALGTVDADDHVWTTVLGGEAGVTRPIADGVLGLSSRAHLGSDPVLEALFARPDDEHVVDHGDGKLVAGLALDLEQRTRVKIAGRMLRGVVQGSDALMAVAVDGTLGNCPKYLNRKTVWPHDASPRPVSDRLPLPAEAVDLIGRADIFFISSRNGAQSMDTNNRGGEAGFVRVSSNSEDEGVTLVYPECSGNRLFQTLGNLTSDPAVGLTFPDFVTGDVLYLTGRAEVLIGAEAAAVLPHSKLAVRVRAEAARFVKDGLPFRGRLLDPSPYNPPVRKLASEMDSAQEAALDSTGKPMSIATASLISKTAVTPTITRYRFRLSQDPAAPLKPWRAGQHITLDFSAQLDRGWSHMRDHDPRSLNDDYIRSFTISSAPERSEGCEFEITVRRQGPVTSRLARWQPGSMLEVAVLGFGGDIRYAETGKDVVVVAAGVGITPLMAQASEALESGQRLKVFWSLNAADLPLAVDVLQRIDGLAAVTKLFVTQSNGSSLAVEGAQVYLRRMEKADVLGAGVAGDRRFYVCTGRALRESVLQWTEGEDVRWEAFEY
ncbi:pyridoxamine 5'-phosphate oxidase family protein [Kineosporia babensis]|uniref:Pyridoxamine 5'-phosphate oxidase family protein n=1 Tax=Kineosporia babensis TaxID=499548 RepID=A0A9X1N8U7_9ACTN|nr:pyridoxamine 5'-phosphate oxidase family protein [Kineosporia babensis]MCD5310537.1 pyridoxamine 5'-phosphate oxidase family protein [Kineosporia babensis]